MNIKTFNQFIPDHIVQVLKRSIYKIDTPRNYWVGINDVPRNNLELYTQESIKFLFPNILREDIVGLEWWYHIGKTIRGVNPHFDCDEQRKMKEKIITTPLGCSINYLTDSVEAPTVITNVEPDWWPSDRFYNPTEVVYSFPGKGKTITFGPRYFHGIKNASLKTDRITLMCNVWNYRPAETVRVNLVEELVELSLSAQDPLSCGHYDETVEPFDFSYLGKKVLLPYPTQRNLYETLHLNL